MSKNLFRQFLDLIPDPALQVGLVTEVTPSTGVVTLEMPGGGVLRVRGSALVGQRVFVRGGVVEGVAPSLPIEIIEV
jgi:hypothetical protein